MPAPPDRRDARVASQQNNFVQTNSQEIFRAIFVELHAIETEIEMRPSLGSVSRDAGA